MEKSTASEDWTIHGTERVTEKVNERVTDEESISSSFRD